MAEDSLTFKGLREAISSGEAVRKDPFGILKDVSILLSRASSEYERAQAQELILRLHEKKEELGAMKILLQGLTREVGLFPYLEPEELTARDQIAVEFHRPFGSGVEELVFHRVQAEVYRYLLDGNNVVLSAPTSFGKSLIVDALISSGRYRNIVIVVPTIALIDETRRRLARFRETHKVVTHPSQKFGDRNVFVLTQERVIDFEGLPPSDLFVVDEFYKLQPETDLDRSYLLNQAFYKLYKTGRQFYLLGPNVEAIPDGFPGKFKCVFFKTDYATVASDTHFVDGGRRPLEVLGELSKSFNEPTLIYCASPARARAVARVLIDCVGRDASKRMVAAGKWIGEKYHPDWLLPQAIQSGIGIHHGRIPRALAQYMVRAFNDGDLRFLVCTSTLIEGVNTKAKNVVIFDNKIARQKYDFFTFNNIRGRSGRMFEHYVGRVFLFHEPPQEELPFVDIPVLTQSESAPDSLLIQLESEDLSAPSRERIGGFLQQDEVSVTTLRKNSGIEPDRQISLAREIRSDLDGWWRRLAWTRWPEGGQLYPICELLWRHFMDPGRVAGISSGKQLAFKINQFRTQRELTTMILQEIEAGDYEDVDDAVEAVLEFSRQWAGYRFPRMLLALNNIQREIFERAGRQPGDYRFFASQIESQFHDPALVALEEYGLPIQISERLQNLIVADGDLDVAIDHLRTLNFQKMSLDSFERDVIEDVVRYL